MPVKNSSAERFVTNLNAAFSRRMDQAQMDVYLEKLSKWHCAEPVWARAMSLIIAECGFLPSIAEIYNYLKRAEKRDGGTSFQLFDVDGVRYARPVKPDRVPGLPIGATNVRLAVDNPARDEHEELCTPEEARAAFLAGYESAGGDRSAFELALRLGQPIKPKRKLKPGHGVFDGKTRRRPSAPRQDRADYDDSPEPVGAARGSG